MWTAPFLADLSRELAAAYPDRPGRSFDGSALHADRDRGHDLCVLDTAHLAAAAFLIEVFAVPRIKGHDYVEVGFLCIGALDGVRHLQGDALTAYREGIALIREAMGSGEYLLGCGAPILPPSVSSTRCASAPARTRTAAPRPDLSQLGRDPPEFTGTGCQLQHGRSRANDPDCPMARPAVKTRERWAGSCPLSCRRVSCTALTGHRSRTPGLSRLVSPGFRLSTTADA